MFRVRRICIVKKVFDTFQKKKYCYFTNKIDHTPVMSNEVTKLLSLGSGQVLVDMTFGAGGHSEYILKMQNNLTIIALDRDPVGYENARRLSEKYPGKIIPLLGKFSDLPELMKSIDFKQNSVDALLFDFGCSSMQFDSSERGFSVSKDGPLDMRMDGTRLPEQPTAMDVLSCASEEDLVKIFKIYGQEKQYKKIARAIVESRYMFRKLESTFELGDLVNSVCGNEIRVDKLNRPVHNATKVFQALRIFVNDELNEINQGMHIAQKYLKIGGRVVTLSFHSLEDTIVKRHIYGHIVNDVPNILPLKYTNNLVVHEKETLDMIADTNWRSITKHVIVPSFDEIEKNPRSRSARLRAAVRVK